jgi:hypothetical protein
MRWLGSIGWDGYPGGLPPAVLRAETEDEFVAEVAEFLAHRDDATLPDQGWPWPWDDSHTTDYAYTWTDRVLVSNFGSPWALSTNPGEGFGKRAGFPNMKAIQNIAWDNRSGLILVRGEEETT